MLFASISAPTKTQWVLGSNPSRITQQIIKSILKKRLLFLYVPRPKRNGTRVRTPAESLNYLKASSFLRMLFFVCAPTKTQWVLGSNPSRITQSFKSILFLRMLFFVCAPTKTQRVLGSNHSRITQQASILFLRMLACFYWCPDQNAMGPGFEPQPNHS